MTKSTLFLSMVLALAGVACAPSGGSGTGDINLGTLGGKADGASRACVELKGDDAIGPGDTRELKVRAASLVASVEITSGGPARVAVDDVEGEPDAQLAVVHARFSGAADREIVVSNLSESSALEGTLCVSSIEVEGVSPELYAAALRNLGWVSKEIDYNHLRKYRLGTDENGQRVPTADQFLHALIREYAGHPEVLESRLRALASMVFFAAPEVLPPEDGRTTPFHGLDMTDFEELMTIEDQIWSRHTQTNGYSKDGVRPFSVCETRYMIDEFVRPNRTYSDWESYRAGFETYKEASCSEADVLDWYNFRGLGHLRPSWDESNIMERVVRRMVDKCDGTSVSEEWKDECREWQRDRLGYRERVNRELSSRFMFYDVETQQSHLATPGQATVLMEDQNGDGVGEFIRPGMYALADGSGDVTVSVESTGQFSGRLRATYADGMVRNIAAADIVAETAVDAGFDPSFWDRADFGLLQLFSDGSGCTGDAPSAEACPLLKRFYVLIDRHENFYSTYSALTPTCSGSEWCLSSQPSPLVACSVTLRASHHWDDAGIPEGGTAGFIFLMRIPFSQILTGDKRNISTLDPPPDVLNVQDLYDGGEELDMSRVWLDIATLSNDLYMSENEISKFGSVPAEQIEGILVVRRPTNMPASPLGGGEPTEPVDPPAEPTEPMP